MLRVSVARTAHEMEKLRERWECCAAATGTVFQRFLWTNLAATMFAATESPVVVAAESDSGLALIPAVLTFGGTVFGLLGEMLFDYRNVLHRGDESVLRRAWAKVSQLGVPLRFTALRRDEHARAWSNLELEAFTNAPGVLRAQVKAEDFLRSHNRLGRQVRRLAQRGATLRRYDGSASELVRAIYERKAEQPNGDIFRDRTRREFMVRVAAADPGGCDVFTYETATQMVAALVTFRHRETRHFYTTYFDNHWAEFSPGQVLLYEATGITLGEGLNSDYMTGEQPYKMRLATNSVPLYRVSASAERLAQIGAGFEFEAPTEFIAA
jgi:CelD/BcsL family acetyltransferase involved in cellulose biosynthesis